MAWELNTEQLWKMMQEGEDFTLVDALSRDQFEKMRIKGSISIPSKETLQEASAKLDKHDKIVVYCSNPQCDASEIAVQKLEQGGYENVYHYAGGIQEWKEAGLPMEGEAVGA